MLPPGLDHRNPHRYGKFTIKVNTQLLKDTRIERVQLTLLGMKRAEERHINSGIVSFDFNITTNLWFFYAYLHDARSINFRLIDTSGKVFNCETTVHLLPSHQVLDKNNNDLNFLFEKNSYLLSRRSRGEVFDSKFSKIGQVEIQMQLVFEEQINRTLFTASLIDFDDILVIDEISPIGSIVELPEEPQNYNPPVPKIEIKQTINRDKNVPESLRYFQQEQKQVLFLPEDDIHSDEKMMQDDIDRLIAQMQSKPYDSSKYMQEDHHQPKQENINRANFLATSSQPYPNQKRSTQKKNSAQKKPQRLPPMMKCQTLKQEYSLSPHNKLSFTATEPVIHYQHSPVLSQTQRQSSLVETEQARDHQKRTGLIRLKVHEFTMSKMQKQLSLLLKIYLNEDPDQFYSVNGLKQGESISFNSNVKIDQRRQIDTISFVMIDAFDMRTIFAQGTFEMSRLFSQNPTKGVFMVNLLSPPTQLQQSMAKVVRMDEQSLVRVVPNLKNLRIQLEYQQPIDIVQIYLSLANFSSQCRKICYKIPLTRQTIQFRLSQLSNGRHMNIFPHNRSSYNRTADRIIIQLWGDVDLIGFNQISLKQISNTNQSIISSSLQPILLYDQTREVVDIKNAKNKTSYWFKLYYGTVAQVQSILNREENRQKRVELPKKPVEVEKHLGIYIKQAKKSRQVEIQVDETHAQDVWRGSQKNILQLQQQELPDDDEDEEYLEENHKESSENQFISPKIEQKYMNGRETIPIPKMTPSSQLLQKPSKVQISQLSQTLKSKTLSSLTKKFQQQISEVLSHFSTQEQLQQLKEQCKPHLLYNFIQTKTLIQILRDMGISQPKIDYLLRDIIPVTNELINVNILYDMVLALILEGEVKEKFIDDAQIGRFCLMVLYRQNMDDQDRDEVIFDQNTEFDESRKFFEAIDYKITMREFNLIHIYLKKQGEAGLTYNKIRQNLLQLHLKKIKEQQVKQRKEKEIVSKLYQHQWDQDDDFFICNINQHNNESHEISINPTINDAASHKSKEIQDNTRLFKATTNNSFKKQNTEIQIPSTMPIPPSQRSRSKDKEILKATERQVVKTRVNFALTIEGFQKCVETTECLLNVSLTAPKLMITHRCQTSSEQSWINFNQNAQSYELQLLIEDSQFFQGSIELVDSSTSLAKCNVSVMSGMKSCYSLKNIQTQQFCGILKLLLTPLQ